MEVIVTHDGLDFDALASAVAAHKLYPEARVLLGANVGLDVREFLSLHKDRYPTSPAHELDASLVQRVVLVDVRRASRLGHVSLLRDRILARASGLEVHVWDHHAAAADDVPAQFEHSQPVGSATTLLIEEIRRRGLAIEAVEATLFALGIHADTGSLRFAGSSARDAAALGFLLERGARLSVINRYAHPAFTDRQRSALRALLAALRVERIGSARVAVALLPEGHATDGLDQVTSEVLALEDTDALLACFQLQDQHLQVIARSRAPWLDVGQALRSVGGGGHPTAGSALITHGDGEAALQTLLAALRANAPRPKLVRDVMSSPVHSVAPDTTVSELRETLPRWKHTGVPVMSAGKLIGIVSRRDVEGVSTSAKGSARNRVSHHMSQPVHTTSEDTPLEEALSRMASADVGRLPVLRGERLVGIVTRSDVLSVLYAETPDEAR